MTIYLGIHVQPTYLSKFIKLLKKRGQNVTQIKLQTIGKLTI